MAENEFLPSDESSPESLSNSESQADDIDRVSSESEGESGKENHGKRRYTASKAAEALFSNPL